MMATGFIAMIIFSLCFLLFINAMSIGLVFPIFAPLFTQAPAPLFAAGVSLSTQSFFYSMILAVPTFFMVFGAPFWGRISDRIGRKTVLIIGLLGVAASFALSAVGILFGSLVILFFSRALAGFMDGSESVAQAAIIDLSEPHQKTRNMSFATFAGTIGFIVGPIVGGFLAEPELTGRFHYEIPFVLSLLLTVGNAFILRIYFPTAKPSIPKDYQEQTSYLQLLSKGFAFCFDRRLRALSFLLWVLQLCLAAFFQLTTLALVEKYHYSSGQVGLFTTFIGATFSAGIFFVIAVFLSRVSHKKLLISGITLMVLAFILAMCLRHSPLFAWISVVPLMLGIAMMYNVLLAFISNAVGAHEQGEAMGSGTALKAIGWLVAGLLVGGLYPNVLAILSVLITLTLISLLVAIKIRTHL